MKQTRILMGMPITVEIILSQKKEDEDFAGKIREEVYEYFRSIDEKFSTYKETSEISKINKGLLLPKEYSDDMKLIFTLSEKTKQETKGFFDIKNPYGLYDPSGLVKGWSIYEASKILDRAGLANYYLEAGGDIQTRGLNGQGRKWSIGIQDPFSKTKIVKVLYVSGLGIATSGTYVRGQHIYNPKMKGKHIEDIVSLTVVGPNIYEADRFATAAFAMGKEGINFIESLSDFEGYIIDKDGIATMTSRFEEYTKS